MNDSVTARAPSRAFVYAAALGLVAMLPGIAHVAILVHMSAASSHFRDVLVWGGIFSIPPASVIASTVRMMRRADRPVGLFVVSLVLTCPTTLLLMGLLTFGADTGWWLLLCLGALASGVVAGIVAIAAALDQRRRA